MAASLNVPEKIDNQSTIFGKKHIENRQHLRQNKTETQNLIYFQSVCNRIFSQNRDETKLPKSFTIFFVDITWLQNYIPLKNAVCVFRMKLFGLIERKKYLSSDKIDPNKISQSGDLKNTSI